MELSGQSLAAISVAPLEGKTVAILGYGNQGRAHALNLRDSGISVVVGSRRGVSFDQATKDGFQPVSPRQAAALAQIVMFLFPDSVIPQFYREIQDLFQEGQRAVGFCHGYSYLYGGMEKFSETEYFLVGPKGAGAILRSEYEAGRGLPGVFAIESKKAQTRQTCLAYAKAIGVAHSVLVETTFQEETECDLFGEQVVLCGGILELMQSAFETLVKNGHSADMAFFECCYEARLILELWMRHGPEGLSRRISPTAFFGGLTRGKRLVTEETKREMQTMFDEIRNGTFAKEWKAEFEAGSPQLEAHRKSLSESLLQKTYDQIKKTL